MPRHTKQAIYAFVTFTRFAGPVCHKNGFIFETSERIARRLILFYFQRLPFVVEINFITSLTFHDALRNAQQRIDGPLRLKECNQRAVINLWILDKLLSFPLHEASKEAKLSLKSFYRGSGDYAMIVQSKIHCNLIGSDFLAELSNKINKSHRKLLFKWGFRSTGVADKKRGYKQRTISELAGNWKENSRVEKWW